MKNLKNLNIAAVPQEVLETLATDMPRSIKWDVMISEGTVFVTDDRGQHEVQLQWLLGERAEATYAYRTSPPAADTAISG